MGEQIARMRIVRGDRPCPFNRAIHLSDIRTTTPLPYTPVISDI
jgi:hypothetical protein